MNRSVRVPFFALLSALLLTSFSIGQERFQNKHEKEDDPAAFAKWFMRSRTPRNTKEPAASLLAKATEQKMKLRNEHLRALQMARQSGARLGGAVASSQVWTPLGPSPIVWNVPSTDASQSWSGRISAVAVDQTDTTGNTVVVGGAYGGIWRTTNAAAASAGSIHWTSLSDDQATLSVGAIAFQPGSGNTIVVGTGEPNGSLDSYYGMGLMVTNDTGAHWTLVQQTSDATPLVLSGKAISGIAFNSRPGSTNNVVAGVASASSLGNDDGLRGAVYSSDAGASWHRATVMDGSTNLTGSSVMTVVYNPKENKFFIVVRYHGVFVSTDQGHTFTRLATQPNSTALSVANCPAATNSSTCQLYRAAMAVRYVTPGTETSSSTIDEMYIWMVGFDNSGNTIDLNLYQTKNGGTSWTKMDETGINAASGGDASGVQQAWYDVYLGAVPNGTGTDLYAGAINIYKCSVTSSNATCATKPFLNLTHVYDGTCSNALYPDVHPDQHGFDYLGSNPKTVYFGNDGGMYRSLDETKLTTEACTTTLNVFDDMNADLGSLAQFIWGAHKYNDPTELLGGTQDNGTMYLDGTLTVPGTNGWYEQLGGDGGYSQIASNDDWYGTNTGVTIQKCPGGWVGCTLWYALIIDGYTGYSEVDGDSNFSAFYTPWILDPQDESKIIVGTCRIWRGPTTTPANPNVVNPAWPNNSLKNALSHKFNSSSDGTCGNLGSDVEVAGIAAGGPKTTAGSKVIYAGTSFSLNGTIGGGLFMTQNAGAVGTAPTSWTDITGSINPYGYNINAVAVDKHDSTGGTVIAGIQGYTGGSGKVWRSKNFGSAWSDISGNLPDVPVNDVLVDPDDTKTIYVATDIGVFVTTDEANWTEVGPNTVGANGFLPNTTVFHIAMYENGSDKRLRAWTHGRGAWETVLPASVTGVVLDKGALSFSGTTGVQTAAQTVTLTNNNATSITLGVPTFTGTDKADFGVDTATTTCGVTLNASSSCTLGVTFTGPGTGSFSASLSVTTTDTTTPSLTVTLSGSVAAPTATDFALSTTTGSASVNAGGSATYTLDISNITGETGAGFNPAITLACTDPANKSACSLSSSSISSSGSVTVTVSTTAPSSASRGPERSSAGSRGTLAFALALPGLAFLIPSVGARRKRALLFLGMMLTFAMILGMGACGGGGNNSTPQPVPGTTPGTYAVKVVASYGSTSHEQDFTLTVN